MERRINFDGLWTLSGPTARRHSPQKRPSFQSIYTIFNRLLFRLCLLFLLLSGFYQLTLIMSPAKRPISEDEKDTTPDRHVKQRVEEPVAEATTESTAPSQSLPYPPKNRPVKQEAIQRPNRLLTFSYDAHRALHFDDSAMKYFVYPPMNADLKYGYSRWIKRPEEKGRIDGLLKAIAKYRQDLDGANNTPARGELGLQWIQQMGCVSWRGVMTK